MAKSFPTGIGLFLLSGTLLTVGVGCTSGNPSASNVSSPSPLPATSSPALPSNSSQPSPVPKPTSNVTAAELYRQALAKADSARNIGDYAQSQDDWQLAARQWQQAIQLLRSLPPSHPNWRNAQRTLAEYQKSLANANQQANRLRSSSIALNSEPTAARPSSSRNRAAVTGTGTTDFSSGPRGIYRARITRRLGGTPVIEVTFNGSQTFEMIVDTGASGTVITESMAAALGVQVVGKAKVDTASARGIEVPLAHIASMAAGGASVNNVVVAIGGPALEVGLLGHDFFDGYDVTIKQDLVEFRSR